MTHIDVIGNACNKLQYVEKLIYVGILAKAFGRLC